MPFVVALALSSLGSSRAPTQHESRGSDPLAEARRAAGQNSRTATEPPINVIAFLKPRLKTRSAHPSARATDMMVADATSEKVGIFRRIDVEEVVLGGAVAATLTFAALCGGSS